MTNIQAITFNKDKKMTNRVQFPLTLFLPLKKEAAPAIRAQLKEDDQSAGALAETKLVHFARLFVFEENNPMGIPDNTLAVITTYDGDFKAYVQAFVDKDGPAEFFDKILGAVDIKGAADLIPVRKNAKAFADLMAQYDATNVNNEPWGSWFSAYPGATVLNIQQALNPS